MRVLRLPLWTLPMAIGASLVVASAAALVVPATSAGSTTQAQGADDLKPEACSGITVGAVLAGSGTITGTGSSELITGSSGADTIDGGGGDDCILGGGGDDAISGGAGTDVCIAGGQPGDTFPGAGDCETAIP
jgi:Ca2+-binding RTX toxin-like protein